MVYILTMRSLSKYVSKLWDEISANKEELETAIFKICAEGVRGISILPQI